MTASVDTYLANFDDWRSETAQGLRAALMEHPALTESLKWGHPVYAAASGPVCLIQVHKAHVTFGFWRGAMMTALEPRLVPHGRFDMAALKLVQGQMMTIHVLNSLVIEAIALNDRLGDPLKTPARVP